MDEITPKSLFLSRREFLRAAGITATALAASACAPTAASPTPTPALADTLTDKESALSFNNFYEFSLAKAEVAKLSTDFKTDPWAMEVGGLVDTPMIYDMPMIKEKFKVEEKVYRMRCVEGWSMVLPWQGFKLAELIRDVSPKAEAKFLRFQTAFMPDQMPGTLNMPGFPWPYTDGLRLDEAMHDLTLLATGLYGEDLAKQNGAPIRLVVPWKYGFKSVKSIVKIEFTSEMPETFWNQYASHEYGFYANVNPAVDHPRWSQATELRIGDKQRRPTLLFNGYDEVASLYTGMDLSVNF